MAPRLQIIKERRVRRVSVLWAASGKRSLAVRGSYTFLGLMPKAVLGHSRRSDRVPMTSGLPSQADRFKSGLPVAERKQTNLHVHKRKHR
jgi:hypothetical protein